MISLTLALLLAAAPAPAPASDKPLAPVAVMPFKDLTNDPELAWLSVGIAETMTVDLRKGSQLQVVERDQLNHALAELKLQGLKPTDESSASKLGKMVGARTVVLGSYQAVDRQLRIVARFVDVETGVVREAAKVTGPTEQVFELQDAIVVKLAGTPFKDAVKRQKQKPKKTLAAYKLYAQSFTVMSDADRAQLLQSALKEDPDFTYAAEDLFDLQDRLKRLTSANAAAVSKNIEAQRAIVSDAGRTPQERLQAAMQLLGAEAADRRHRAILRDSAWILGSDLPDGPPYNIRQYALFSRINAYQALKEQSLAMQAAENFMQQYPGSMYFTGVQAELNAWMMMQATHLEKQRTYEAQLALKRQSIENERSRARAPVPPHRQFSWQEEPCDVMEDHEQYDAAARCYRELLTHRIDAPELAQRYDGVRVRLIRAETDAGQFEAARRDIEAFQKDEPDVALRFGMNMYLLGLPND